MTAWRASEESSLYLRLCTVFAIHRFSCLHFLASATSLGFSLFYLHRIFLFLLSFYSEPSVVLSPSPSLVWNEHCIPDVYAATTTTTTKQTLLLHCTSLTWSWFGSNRPDWWPIKSTSHARNEKQIKVCAFLCKTNTFPGNVSCFFSQKNKNKASPEKCWSLNRFSPRRRKDKKR